MGLINDGEFKKILARNGIRVGIARNSGSGVIVQCPIGRFTFPASLKEFQVVLVATRYDEVNWERADFRTGFVKRIGARHEVVIEVEVDVGEESVTSFPSNPKFCGEAEDFLLHKYVIVVKGLKRKRIPISGMWGRPAYSVNLLGMEDQKSFGFFTLDVAKPGSKVVGLPSIERGMPNLGKEARFNVHLIGCWNETSFIPAVLSPSYVDLDSARIL